MAAEDTVASVDPPVTPVGGPVGGSVEPPVGAVEDPDEGASVDAPGRGGRGGRGGNVDPS